MKTEGSFPESRGSLLTVLVGRRFSLFSLSWFSLSESGRDVHVFSNTDKPSNSSKFSLSYAFFTLPNVDLTRLLF